MGTHPVLFQLVRHGRVASHRGDVPVTPEGLREVEAAGRRIAMQLTADDAVDVLYSPTLRSQDTALTLHRTIVNAIGVGSETGMKPPREEWALRNPDLFVGGRRVEMVTNGEAMITQLPDMGLTANDLHNLAFYGDFFDSPDRIGMWLAHPNPPGENAEAVARRIMAFAGSLLDLPSAGPRRYICVSHSPIMRAFVRYYLTHDDVGEPDWVEAIDVRLSDETFAVVRFRDREIEVPLLGR